MKVKIYKPAQTAMQSGSAKTHDWLLEADTTSGKKPEPLMGWTASQDTQSQIKMRFSSQESAIAFAQDKGWDYSVAAEQRKKVKPRNYVDNFRYKEPKETINK